MNEIMDNENHNEDIDLEAGQIQDQDQQQPRRRKVCFCCTQAVVDLQGSSYDLSILYDVFGSLIRDRDFANNNFLH